MTFQCLTETVVNACKFGGPLLEIVTAPFRELWDVPVSNVPLILVEHPELAGLLLMVHGLAPKPGADYTQLATAILTLCGRILLTVVAKEVGPAGKFVDLFYGASK